MISFEQKGDFKKLSRYFERLREVTKLGVLDKYGREGVFTIVEVMTGKGSNSGWGKLKSGAGWIPLDKVKRV